MKKITLLMLVSAIALAGCSTADQVDVDEDGTVTVESGNLVDAINSDLADLTVEIDEEVDKFEDELDKTSDSIEENVDSLEDGLNSLFE